MVTEAETDTEDGTRVLKVSPAGDKSVPEKH
ncbi:hypothetical protein DFJ65_2128 [Calidifontibacter indicus]|uniref:Uncharacterized protein n=1 Tax=Calidifontibacter indicus TaxID=419650 RepID=A0A3D9UP83_9MICO|nr:hypothetical protein DFJ65_2128 [Calidifontibacter indicus]